MKKITVDLRPSAIHNIDDAVTLVRQAKEQYPGISSIIMSPSQEEIVAETDHELTEVRMKIGQFMGVPSGKIGYEIYQIDDIDVEIE